MLEYKEIKIEENNDIIYKFKGADASQVDRFWWASALGLDLDEPKATIQLPGDDSFVEFEYIPTNFNIFKMTGYSKSLKCNIVFMYFKDGKIEISINNKECNISDKEVIEYVFNRCFDRYYLQGWEESARYHNKIFIEETGVTISEAMGLMSTPMNAMLS